MTGTRNRPFSQSTGSEQRAQDHERLRSGPVTQGYPFEVVIPQDLPIEGVILSDQIKSLDWQSRQAKFICRVPKKTLDEVLHKVDLLIH
ncbi:type II toxin-antitoxin system PemK/MazF family toxin [Paenibacillus glucanolyticus]|uniref:type II toxin-antitoxin system PemK/MazF family toxin n=1 Tax=Paenibacillus glucanolyticus TaxID=59843 RepID=UPI002284BFEF|nr:MULTISPECIES: type II toxin-antitoxin system PemK/MazF family toxin [Paenibacillus]